MATTKVRRGDVVIRAYSRGELRAVRSVTLTAPNLYSTVQVTRLATGLPLSQLHLPYLFDADIGAADVDDLARALLGGISSIEAARR